MDYTAKSFQNKKIVIIRPDFAEGTERESGPLLECIQKALDHESPAAVVINLEKVGFMDSNFLGGLVKGLKAALKSGSELHVTNLQAPVKSMFELTRLQNIFQIFESEQSAFESL